MLVWDHPHRGWAAGLLALGLLLAGVGRGEELRYFSFDYAKPEQPIVLYSLTNLAQRLAAWVYQPDGKLWGRREVPLRGFESLTLTDLSAAWGLPAGAPGQPDPVYGVIVRGQEPFSLLVNTVNPGLGDENCAIHPQADLFDDCWWSMYHVPGAASGVGEHFLLFNANATATRIKLVVYASDGRQLGAPREFEVPAYQTRRLRLQEDLGVASDQRNVGLHLTASLGVALHVVTVLGTGWDFGGGSGWRRHDQVAGAFIPWQQDHNARNFAWVNSVAPEDLAAARVTNITGRTATVTLKVFPTDGTGPVDGNHYEVRVDVPAHGTVEVPLPGDGLAREVNQPPYFPCVRLESTQPVAVHSSFEQDLEAPLSERQWLRGYWWGVQDPTGERTVMIGNPHNRQLTIHTEAYYWAPKQDGQEGEEEQVREAGQDLKLKPYQALAFSLVAKDPGPGFTGRPRMVVHFQGNRGFACQLQEPKHGDVRPVPDRKRYLPWWGGGGVDRDHLQTRRLGGNQVDVMTNAQGDVVAIQLTQETRDATGRLVWLEIYAYEPRAGVVLDPPQVQQLVDLLLTSPVLPKGELVLLLNLSRHEVLWEPLPPEMTVLPQPRAVSPDGV